MADSSPAEEFERRSQELRAAGEIVDPRDAHVVRLKQQGAELKERFATRDERVAELTEFKVLAISRLAAQYDEIERLREQTTNGENVRRLPVSRNGAAPYGSCS
ncbi:hypothetical protein ACH4U5_34985 [Streptomyces sp. NPDC020858]|uniref:hypothetical protein n=1 Tax=Streptomyces sp. NPDC020858 TaxID=3365097 RepID=UPI0037B1C649